MRGPLRMVVSKWQPEHVTRFVPHPTLDDVPVAGGDVVVADARLRAPPLMVEPAHAFALRTLREFVGDDDETEPKK